MNGRVSDADVLAAFDQVRSRTLDFVSQLTPVDLSQPTRSEGGTVSQLATQLVATTDSAATTDVLVEHVIDLVITLDDLCQALDRWREVVEPAGKLAMRLACRSLAQRLAATAPGQALEVRVPPYTAVQCLPGPRHTRGTPPAVVEMAPVTWLRLATGRLTWTSAIESSLVRASGSRANLGPWLPVRG